MTESLKTRVLHTKINTVEEGQIQRGSDGELLVLGENDVPAIVALLNSSQDVGRIVFTIAESLDAAGLGSWR